MFVSSVVSATVSFVIGLFVDNSLSVGVSSTTAALFVVLVAAAGCVVIPSVGIATPRLNLFGSKIWSRRFAASSVISSLIALKISFFTIVAMLSIKSMTKCSVHLSNHWIIL